MTFLLGCLLGAAFTFLAIFTTFPIEQPCRCDYCQRHPLNAPATL